MKYRITGPVSVGGDYTYAGTLSTEYRYQQSRTIATVGADSVATWIAETSATPTQQAAFSLVISGNGTGAKFVVTAARSYNNSSRFASSNSSETRYSELKVYDNTNTLRFTIPFKNSSGNGAESDERLNWDVFNLLTNFSNN